MSDIPGMGERLRNTRLNLGLTQNQLCQKLEISRTSLAQYENGARVIDPRVLAKLHERFGVDLNWLVCGDTPAVSENDDALIKAMLKQFGFSEERFRQLARFIACVREDDK